MDVILCLAWFASFGALYTALNDVSCDGSIIDIFGGPISNCKRWTAGESFAFISGFLWLISSILVCPPPQLPPPPLFRRVMRWS